MKLNNPACCAHVPARVIPLAFRSDDGIHRFRPPGPTTPLFHSKTGMGNELNEVSRVLKGSHSACFIIRRQRSCCAVWYLVGNTAEFESDIFYLCNQPILVA